MIQDTMLSLEEAIAKEPAPGEKNRGDLNGVFVHKFKLNHRETLLTYRLKTEKLAPQEIVLPDVGPHENFYTQLER